MVWYNLKVGSWDLKYTGLSVADSEFKACDSEGRELEYVSGKVERGYYVNPITKERVSESFKLINGKASQGFKGRVKEVTNYKEVDKAEAENLIVEGEFLVRSEALYNELTASGKALKFGGWFGNGFKAYICYVVPSELYKGFLIMSKGRGLKSELISSIVAELKEFEQKQKLLTEINTVNCKVDKAKVEDLIAI